MKRSWATHFLTTFCASNKREVCPSVVKIQIFCIVFSNLWSLPTKFAIATSYIMGLYTWEYFKKYISFLLMHFLHNLINWFVSIFVLGSSLLLMLLHLFMHERMTTRALPQSLKACISYCSNKINKHNNNNIPKNTHEAYCSTDSLHHVMLVFGNYFKAHGTPSKQVIKPKQGSSQTKPQQNPHVQN